MIGFGIDEIQAEHVAEIKLRHLNREYILKKLKDVETLEQEIADMEDVLKSRSRINKIIVKELEEIIKTLEENSVTLSFENLPYLEGFPCEAELGEIVRHFSSPFIKGWLDTGHDAVRRNLCYVDSDLKLDPTLYAGVHVNDIVKYEDDHLPPGYGSIDFSQYADIFANVEHIVFEPNQNITEENLKKGIENYERQLQS
jgi:sugar phosphate isomerase/epimerase